MMNPYEVERRIMDVEIQLELFHTELTKQIKDLMKRILDIEKKKSGIKPKTS